ncbi:MAG: ERF family protein [Clostridia bacterium]|nr:ERF family protein [Clostridia bacterium]
MIESENIAELLSALVEIQNEMPTFPKGSQGYGYKYTDLDCIVKTIKPILYKHSVGYMQSVGACSGVLTLTTRLFNSKGQYIEDTTILPEINGVKANSAQVAGMSITYMRRYCLCSMLGITSDEDIDANAFERENSRQDKKAEPPKQAQTKEKQQPIVYADGKEATPEEAARLQELGKALYLNGQPIFSSDEKKIYFGYRTEKTARQLIEFMENALRNRRADAPELPENKK